MYLYERDVRSSAATRLGRPASTNSEETRERIIAATMRCVAEVGYSRATIRAIARAAQVTSGSLYHYFPNKAELVTAAFNAVTDIAEPRLAVAAERGRDPASRLISVLEELDHLVREYPFVGAFDRALRVESAQFHRLLSHRESVWTALRNVVVDIVEEARRDRVLARGVDVESVADALYAMFMGLNEFGGVRSADDYHATVRALKLLIRGNLFVQRRLK